MVWLTLRRLRTELIIVGVVTFVVAVALVVSGLIIHHAYDQSGYAHCAGLSSSFSGVCLKAYNAFFPEYGAVRQVTPWLNTLPLFVGILLGIPLFANEFEARTYKFVLTQGISRRRWALTQVCVPIVCVVAFSLILTYLMTWWNAPFDQVESRYTMSSWDFEGLMPLAFGLLALAICIWASGILKHAISAVATAFAYIPLWLLSDMWLRTILPTPITLRYAYQDAPTFSPHDWIISEGVTDSSGHPVYGVAAGTSQQGFQGYTIYQPASHYWQVQSAEAGILIGIAVIMLMVVIWHLSRKKGAI